MAEEALEIVRHRFTFYRDHYRRLIGILIGMVFANIVMVGGLHYVVTHPRPPEYFATSPDGRITKIEPLSQPVYSVDSILDWAASSAMSVYSFDFVNYRGQLQKSSEFFTAKGWKNFQNALASSRNLETVISRKLVSTAVPTGAPVVLNRGVINGTYAWKIQIPLLVSYQSSSTNIQQPVVVTIVVVRTPVLSDPKGIAIAQFVASNR